MGLQSTNGTAMLASGGKRVSCDIAADAPTTNANPPITSNFDFYVTLTAELADDISLRHIILFFNFIKFTNPTPNPNPNPNPNPKPKPKPNPIPILSYPILSYPILSNRIYPI